MAWCPRHLHEQSPFPSRKKRKNHWISWKKKREKEPYSVRSLFCRPTAKVVVSLLAPPDAETPTAWTQFTPLCRVPALRSEPARFLARIHLKISIPVGLRLYWRIYERLSPFFNRWEDSAKVKEEKTSACYDSTGIMYPCMCDVEVG